MFARAIRTLAATGAIVATFAGIGSPATTAEATPARTDVRVEAAALSAPTYADPYRANQWAMTRMQGEILHARRKATNVVVAVIDSGVQGNHPDLQGRFVPGWDFTTDQPGGAVDGYGHGTHVAGLVAANPNNRVGIAGIAPEAKIMPLRVLDNKGTGYAGDVAAALVFAANHGAKIATVSLAADRTTNDLTKAVAYAQSKGVIIVAAAGNNRLKGNTVSYPAALPGVIGVGAEDKAGAVASYSNAGSYVDVVAPGSVVVSSYKGGSFAYMSGTSMAAPYVAGTLAVLAAAKPGLTPAQALTALQRTARDMGTRGIDTATGAGEIQPVKALCTLQRCA